MLIQMLKSKIHRATVTEANLNYEGSISIDPALCDIAKIRPWEQVDIYNCNNGERFTTYVILGKPGQIGLNGAAARKVQPGDLVIIVTYATFTEDEATSHIPKAVFVDGENKVKEVRTESNQH
jgi:aspartate 1-decarboxylase